MKATHALVALVMSTAAAHSATVHHYRLDETFQHEAIRDAFGAVDGSSTPLERGRTGAVGGAHSFTETDFDHIDLGPANNLIPTGAFTVTLWIHFSSNGLDDNERMLDCSDGNSFAQMTSGFNFKAQSGGLRVFVGDGTNKTTTPISTTPLSQNRWTLVALRFEPSSTPGTASDGRAQVTAIAQSNEFVDASAIAALTDRVSHQVGPINTADNLLAGIPPTVPNDAALAFDGRMDDIRIYDTFLTDQELADLHNATVPVGGGLRWTFNVDGDTEGWSTVNTSSDAVTGGAYAAVSSGPDPQTLSPDNLGLDLTGVQKVFLRVRNGSTGTTARIFFETDADPTFVGHFVDFPVSATDTSDQDYVVDVSGHPDWTGTLKRLRIDLPNDAGDVTGAEIRLNRVAVGESGNRPNILFVMADDLGWRDIGVNGSTFYQTPHIDQLAAEGVNYPNAFSANPLCSPTRAGILTGQYPARVRFNTPAGHVANVELDPGVGATADPYLPSTAVGTRTRLPNGYVTYAEVMKAAGFSTSFMGKWHLGKDEYIPDNQGFDRVIGGRQHPGPPGGYFAPFSGDSNIPSLLPDGTPVATGDHINDVLAAFAADYIADQRHRPFLLNLWWYDVHAPFQAKADVRATYLGQSSTDGRQKSATMGAMVESLDEGMGVVLDQLSGLGLDDETIVIFTSDNGGWMYSWIAEDVALPTHNFPSRGGKATIWDGGSHVPFIVKWPGVVAGGQTSTDLVNNLDVHATILDMVDLDPHDPSILDSQSLVPSLIGNAPLNNNVIYNQFPQSPPATATFPGVWVRQGDMKLIRFFHGNGGLNNHRFELYNIATDPGEETNLADASPGLVATLDALIELHLIDTDALVPLPNPNYVPPVFDGWTPNQGVWVQDGSLGRIKMVSNSYLPALDSPDLSSLAAPTAVRVTMRSRSLGDGRVWWKLPGDPDFTPAKSAAFAVTHDDTERTITVPIAPGGPVSQLRFQPSSDYFETEVALIEVLDGASSVIAVASFIDSDGDGMTDGQEALHQRNPLDASDLAFEFNDENDTEGWTANNISDFQATTGRLIGVTASADPQLSRTGFSFDANVVDDITVKLKADANGSFQFFWGRQGADAFAAARRLDLAYAGAGDWDYVQIPTATAGSEWVNQTITRMRIDPIGIQTTSFEIGWIRAIDGDFDNDTLPDVTEGAFDRDTDGDGVEDFADRDSDNDGAPDEIESREGRNPYAAVEGSLDADQDNYTDLFEMVAGTDPDDKDDNLGETYVIEPSGTNISVQVALNGRAGRRYALEGTADLSQTNWSLKAESAATTDGPLVLSDVLPEEFYYLRIGLTLQQ